jgi:hypothetical protein
MKLTKRGERVFTALLLIAGLALVIGIYQVIGNLWWVGDGYCWGSMVECMGGKL